MSLAVLGAVAGSYTVGFLTARRRYRRPLPTLAEPPPRTEEAYQKDRAFCIELYKESMQQYDKLVPWAAGGALVLSTTLLHDVAKATVSPGARSVLGSAWLFPFMSLMASVGSHFASSRIYSSERRALDLLHRGSGTDETRREAAEHRHIADVSSKITYWLNYVSGGSLLIGLGRLGVWAYLSLF